MAKSKGTDNRKIRLIWLFVFSPLLLLFLMILLAWIGAFGALPSFEELENPKSNQASIVYSSDGSVIGKYYIQNRTSLKYDEISPNVIHALIATEDERFYSHSGIDGKALLRAIFSFGRDGGASTITQQLAKNLFHDRPSNKLERVLQKIKEWVIALKLERAYTKTEILAMYLNTADFGHEIYGINTAAKVFFNKIPSELDVPEAALLVGLLKAPTRYSAIKYPERSKSRRNTVLEQMVKNEKITQEEAEKYKQTEIIKKDKTLYERIQRNQYGTGDLAPHFVSELKKDLQEWCKTHKKSNGENYNIYRDGLRVYTTIDSKMQAYAEEAVQTHMKELQDLFFKTKKNSKNGPFDSRLAEDEKKKIIQQAMKSTGRYREMKDLGMSETEIEAVFKKPLKMKVYSTRGDIDTIMSPLDSIIYYKYFLQTGLMSMEVHTGHIKAWVGGIDFRNFKYDHVKASKRQVGSTFKPFVYSMAMMEGISPCFQVPNIKVCIDNWCPSNSSDYKEGQMISLKEALANSINYISAYLMKQYGPHSIIKQVRKMGIVSPIDAVPAICLGTSDISVYEMVGAFNVFSNKGVYIKPQYLVRIEDKNGNLLEEFYPERSEAMDEQSAYLTIQLMKGVVEMGTGWRLRGKYKFTWPVAGKTGTTQSNSDGWFIGTTPDITTGVWVGAEDRTVRFSSTAYGQGANTGLPIFGIYMNKVYADAELKYNHGDWARPAGEMRTITDCSLWRQEEQDRVRNNIDNFDNAKSKDEDFDK